MSDISKYWVMIPIGFNDEHKKEFVEHCNKINPTNDVRELEVRWEMLHKRNVLQVVIDIRSGETQCSMVASPVGTSWQLSKDIIKSITNIKNYTPITEEDMFREELSNMRDEIKVEAIKYNVDSLLDKISAEGYPSLTVGEKEFLTSLKK
jgi:hypothetical protein